MERTLLICVQKNFRRKKMNEEREFDIDLKKVFYMMRTKIVYIVLSTIFVSVLAGLYTHFFVRPVYQTSVSMCVYSSPNRISYDADYNPSDITAATNLVGTYMYVLTTDTVLDKVAADLDLGSGSNIKNYITASAVEETFAFKVTVKSTDPKTAVDIANAIAKIAPEEIAKAVKGGSISVLDTAKLPRTPVSPNTKKNILIGALTGFIASFLIFFIYEIFDTTITNAKDLEREFQLPVLGTVPLLEAVEREEVPEIPEDSSAQATSLPKPSSALLENLQSMKGDAKND